MTSAIVKYAALSEFVYSRSDKDQAIFTEQLAEDVVDEKNSSGLVNASGFYAEQWSVGGKTVIAFRGTDFADVVSKDHVQGNIPLATGNLTAQQWVDAKQYVEMPITKSSQAANSSPAPSQANASH